MKRTLPVGLAMLAPLLVHTPARAQPQQAPIVATPLPLLPPPERSPPPGQPQVAQPQYQSPQYQSPQYQSPQYQQPQYQQPQYQQPQFQAPQYQSPQYQPSQGQQPQYQQPQGQPPQFQQPPFQQPQGQPPQVQQQPLPVAPAPGQPSAQGQGQPAAPEQPAPPPSNPWLPQGSAVLRMLDKVNAQTTTQTVRVGQTVTYESLSIAVQACMVRPPDMPQDAAAFLTITDSHPDQPGFKGWMLKSDPSLAMLEHPLYDVRVVGCAP